MDSATFSMRPCGNKHAKLFMYLFSSQKGHRRWLKGLKIVDSFSAKGCSQMSACMSVKALKVNEST